LTEPRVALQNGVPVEHIEDVRGEGRRDSRGDRDILLEAQVELENRSVAVRVHSCDVKVPQLLICGTGIPYEVGDGKALPSVQIFSHREAERSLPGPVEVELPR